MVTAWATAAGDSFSLRALFVCEAAFLSFYLVGSLFAAWTALAAGALFDLPLRLLMGYAAVNTALLALAWLSPLGILANFGAVLAVAVALFLGETGPATARRFGRSSGSRPVARRDHAVVPRLAPPDSGRR